MAFEVLDSLLHSSAPVVNTHRSFVLDAGHDRVMTARLPSRRDRVMTAALPYVEFRRIGSA